MNDKNDKNSKHNPFGSNASREPLSNCCSWLARFVLLMGISSGAFAGIVTAAYDGVIHDVSGGQDFTAIYADATTFHGVLSYETTDPSQLISNDLVVLNSSGAVLMNFSMPDSRRVFLEDAFFNNADNIYIDETYSSSSFSSASPVTGLMAEVYLDIYDASGDLLFADNQWPATNLDINDGGFSTILSIGLYSSSATLESHIGSLEGSVPVPGPATFWLLLAGALAIRPSVTRAFA